MIKMILLLAMMIVPNFHNVRCEYLLEKLNTQTDALDYITPEPVPEIEPTINKQTGAFACYAYNLVNNS